MRELARLARDVTSALDRIVASLTEGSAGLEALREIAQEEPYWPTMARPNDPKFSQARLEKLGVSKKAPVSEARKTKPASLATPANRITTKLVRRLTNLAYALSKSGDDEALVDLGLVTPDVPEKGLPYQRRTALDIVRKIQGLPSPSLTDDKRSIDAWADCLTDFVLIIDPELNDPDLQQPKKSALKRNVSRKAAYRSELRKFFLPVLRRLAHKKIDT
jgi:hypothetical protein